MTSNGRSREEGLPALSRRERQIMDILYGRGGSSVEEVRKRLPDPPGYSAVRALLARLEDKGHVRHTEENLRYVYHPVVPRSSAQKSAVSRLVNVFFRGSVTGAVTGLLDMAEGELSDAELVELKRAIEMARKRKEEPDVE